MVSLKPIFLLFTFLNVTLTFGKNATAPLLEKEFEIKYFGTMTWFNAHLSCLSCGGQLASIESEAEQNQITALVNGLGLRGARFWIAGTDLANEGIFSWFTTGNVFRYSNFPQGQPDNENGTEHCVEIREFVQMTWNDKNCDNLAFFICETKPKC